VLAAADARLVHERRSDAGADQLVSRPVEIWTGSAGRKVDHLLLVAG
jgi:hypothetical protein